MKTLVTQGFFHTQPRDGLITVATPRNDREARSLYRMRQEQRSIFFRLSAKSAESAKSLAAVFFCLCAKSLISAERYVLHFLSALRDKRDKRGKSSKAAGSQLLSGGVYRIKSSVRSRLLPVASHLAREARFCAQSRLAIGTKKPCHWQKSCHWHEAV